MNIPVLEIVFYLFSAILVAAAAAVITVRNPVHAALFLVLAFFSSAAIWLLLEAEFLAVTLVLVYVGAVMVLFLFVVMMLDIRELDIRRRLAAYLPLGLTVALAMAAELFIAIWTRGYRQAALPAPGAKDYSNTRALGELLYSQYLYPFEIAAVILLVAIVAAIVLTLRRRPETKAQNPSRQVQVKSTERVRLVSLPVAGRREDDA